MRIGDSRRSKNVQDYRGQRMRGPGMKFGLGTIILLIIGWFVGINPLAMLGMVNTVQQVVPQQAPEPAATGTPTDAAADFMAAVLGETEDAWGAIFQQNGSTYRPPALALFSGQIQSACGFASAASGPFYCPLDQKVYIDLSFYEQLEREFGAPGDFAKAYVLAHEVGHHVQNLLGTMQEVRQVQERAPKARQNQYSVALELQADCYAGIWAHNANKDGRLLEAGDFEEGLAAAAAVGDDRIQRQTQGYVQPESFTHGSAEQRTAWFRRGFESGKLDACNTFGG